MYVVLSLSVLPVSEEGNVFDSVLLWSNVGNGSVTIGEEIVREIGKERLTFYPSIDRTGYCRLKYLCRLNAGSI